MSLRDLSPTRRRMDEIAFDLFPVLREKADAQAGNLSGGEQKMLGVGRAAPRASPPARRRTLGRAVPHPRPPGLRPPTRSARQGGDGAHGRAERQVLETSDYGMVLQQGRLALAGRAAEVLYILRSAACSSAERRRGRRRSTPTALAGLPSPRDRPAQRRAHRVHGDRQDDRSAGCSPTSSVTSSSTPAS